MATAFIVLFVLYNVIAAIVVFLSPLLFVMAIIAFIVWINWMFPPASLNG